MKKKSSTKAIGSEFIIDDWEPARNLGKKYDRTAPFDWYISRKTKILALFERSKVPTRVVDKIDGEFMASLTKQGVVATRIKKSIRKGK